MQLNPRSIQIAGVAGYYKIEFITDAVSGSGKLDKAILTAVLPGSGAATFSGSCLKFENCSHSRSASSRMVSVTLNP